MRRGEWNMGEEDTFENLKYLCLEEVTLAKWEFGEESFPMLEKLALWRCRKLIEIPPNFGDIGSLKIIQLVESPQLEDSSLKIRQYVEDMTGWDALKLPHYAFSISNPTPSAPPPCRCYALHCDSSATKRWRLQLCETIDKKLIKNLMQEGFDGDAEPFVRNYSSVGIDEFMKIRMRIPNLLLGTIKEQRGYITRVSA
ncbi:hypothetical protein CQW23_13680 [Capsicum baccatum]|uniref:NB-ARC domain-containing protein n=1 Tax=Capsicum baccatum TaxID=33114 RepID=A0A2G2WH24_CAPBA|nr:hypothetical protein CQW23_13680 [Capsicum baccatum]